MLVGANDTRCLVFVGAASRHCPIFFAKRGANLKGERTVRGGQRGQHAQALNRTRTGTRAKPIPSAPPYARGRHISPFTHKKINKLR